MIVMFVIILPSHQVLCVVACFAGSAALHALPVYMSTFHANETRMMGFFFLGMGGLVIFEQVFFAVIGWADKTGKKVSVKQKASSSSASSSSANNHSSFPQLQEKLNAVADRNNLSSLINSNNSNITITTTANNNNTTNNNNHAAVEDSPLIMTAAALAAAAAAALTTGLISHHT